MILTSRARSLASWKLKLWRVLSSRLLTPIWEAGEVEKSFQRQPRKQHYKKYGALSSACLAWIVHRHPRMIPVYPLESKNQFREFLFRNPVLEKASYSEDENFRFSSPHSRKPEPS